MTLRPVHVFFPASHGACSDGGAPMRARRATEAASLRDCAALRRQRAGGGVVLLPWVGFGTYRMKPERTRSAVRAFPPRARGCLGLRLGNPVLNLVICFLTMACMLATGAGGVRGRLPRRRHGVCVWQ